MHPLSSKTAIVTGSSTGIGRAIALRLGRLGAHVVVTSRTMTQAEEVAAEINDAGGQATPCPFNLGHPEDIPTLLEAALSATGRIDFLVNNALDRTSMAPKPFQDMTFAQLQAGITSNLTTILALTAAAHPHLKQTRGMVLNIGSAVVHRHTLGIPLYTILKGAMSQTTKVLASEWARDGIRVNQINPGFVRTESITARQGDEAAQAMSNYFEALHPLGRVGEVEDIAALAAFLASTEADWITGASIDIDGGFSVQGASFPAPAGR